MFAKSAQCSQWNRTGEILRTCDNVAYFRARSSAFGNKKAAHCWAAFSLYLRHVYRSERFQLSRSPSVVEPELEEFEFELDEPLGCLGCL